MTILQHWIPAFAGMTSRTIPFSCQSYRRKPARSAIQVFFWICWVIPWLYWIVTNHFTPGSGWWWGIEEKNRLDGGTRRPSPAWLNLGTTWDETSFRRKPESSARVMHRMCGVVT